MKFSSDFENSRSLIHLKYYEILKDDIVAAFAEYLKVMFDINQIDQHFPLAKYREGQKEAIAKVLNAWNSGK